MRTIPLHVRFWKYVNRTDTCWLWTGTTHEFGYGMLYTQKPRTKFYAHRVSWEMHHGPIPSDMSVLHRCDVAACVNPLHLFLGTQQDNIADAVTKNRIAKGNRLPQTKLTVAQVREIRSLKGTITHRALAPRYGVSYRTIGRVMHGDYWHHVR